MTGRDLPVEPQRQDTSREVETRNFAISILRLLFGFYILPFCAFSIVALYCLETEENAEAWHCFGILFGIGLSPMLFLGLGALLIFIRRYWFAMLVAAIPAIASPSPVTGSRRVVI